MSFTLSFSNRVRASLLGAGMILTLGASQMQAARISDPTGDFLPSFTGPHNGDLDVLSAEVLYTGPSFSFTSTLNGPIGTTPTALYVWGIDRGMGTVGFPTLAPGVTFDSVFIINPSGTSSVRDTVNNTVTPISNITVSGSTVSATVPTSALPSLGLLAPSAYLFSLWPRDGASGNGAISDFAPNNSDVPVTNATPEPGTMSLVGAIGLLGLGLVRRFRNIAG